MTTIRIPTHAVVTVVGGRRDPIAEVAALIDAPSAPWDVNKPKEALEQLHAALSAEHRARVAMPNAHAKARKDVSTAARRHGAVSVVLRLPGADPVDAAGEKHHAVHDVPGPEGLAVEWTPMPVDLRHLAGPFDIVGDVHGAHAELAELLTRLGHMDGDGRLRRHPDGRILVFLGDYTDRGPANRAVLETVRAVTELGGVAVLGNHDAKLLRWLRGKDVRVAAGLAMTIAELEATTPEWRADMADWLEGLETHYVLDGGRLVVAHAGLSEEHHGRRTGAAISMGMYGKPLEGGTVLDEEGHPMAEDWAQTYAGAATVVHGHVVHVEPREVNRVHAIDTGAVFGGHLTAMRYPEMEYVQVKAHAVYFAPHGALAKAGA